MPPGRILISTLPKFSQSNETAFMNGVNEVQSSSMVQYPNVAMLSSPVTPSVEPEDRLATIVDEEDEVEPLESIPERVLSELPMTVSNTQQSTPIQLQKQPVDALRSSTNGRIVRASDANSVVGNRNKEN